MEKVTSLLLHRACHTALSHCCYKWNKSVAFLFFQIFSDALKGCITHWTLHFSFPCLHNALRNSSWVIQRVTCAKPNLHTPYSKQYGIRLLLLAGHKKSCLSLLESALQKGNHEKEEKNSGFLEWCCPFTRWRWQCRWCSWEIGLKIGWGNGPWISQMLGCPSHVAGLCH